VKKLRLSAAFLITLFLAAACIGIIGVQASEPEMPNPTSAFYFNDFARVLDTDSGSYIARLGESTYKSTNGGQVVFVSISTLGGSTIEEYSNALFNKWKIGTEDKGVLFLLSMKERESRIEVGYGYEGVLTDIESNKLLVKFSELNEEKGIDEAVMTIYTDICSIVSGNEDAVQYPEMGKSRRYSITGGSFFLENPVAAAVLVIIVLVLLILDIILTRGRVTFIILRMLAASSRRGGGGGRRNSGGGGRSGGGGSSSRF